MDELQEKVIIFYTEEAVREFVSVVKEYFPHLYPTYVHVEDLLYKVLFLVTEGEYKILCLFKAGFVEGWNRRKS